MATTTYVLGTVVQPSWLNDLDNLRYGLGNEDYGANLLQFMAAGSGASTRTMQDKGREMVSTMDFGGGVSNPIATNRTALSAALSAVDEAGGGYVVVPGGVNYGYIFNDSNSYPDFSATSTDIAVIDYGPGFGDGGTLTFTTTLAAGAVSGTLSVAWSGISNTFLFVFSNGDARMVSLVNGATTATWSPGLSSAATATATEGGNQGAQVRMIFNTQPTAAPVTFTAGLSAGATSGTITAAWALPSGPYLVTFSNGDERPVTFTLSDVTATWTTGLSSSATVNATYEQTNHNGNCLQIEGNWHPGLVLNNTQQIASVGQPSRLATDNRRNSIVWAINGSAIWLFGSGGIAGYDKTDSELSNIRLAYFPVASGDAILTQQAPLIIERATLNWSIGAATNIPPASLHVSSVLSGQLQGMFENTHSTTSTLVLRNSVGSAEDIYLRNSGGSYALHFPAVGDAFTVTKTTRKANFRSTSYAISTITYATTMVPDITAGNFFVITATDGVAFTIDTPLNRINGQEITFTIRNTSGGALGAVTWHSIFKMAAWTSPATGFSRSITFYYNGSNYIEIDRTAADIPN